MTGIEILATREIATEFAFNWNVFLITFSVILGMFVLIGIFISLVSYDWSNLIGGIVAGAAIGMLIGAWFGDAVLRIPVTYKTQYKVLQEFQYRGLLNE